MGDLPQDSFAVIEITSGQDLGLKKVVAVQDMKRPLKTKKFGSSTKYFFKDPNQPNKFFKAMIRHVEDTKEAALGKLNDDSKRTHKVPAHFVQTESEANNSETENELEKSSTVLIPPRLIKKELLPQRSKSTLEKNLLQKEDLEEIDLTQSEEGKLSQHTKKINNNDDIEPEENVTPGILAAENCVMESNREKKTHQSKVLNSASNIVPQSTVISKVLDKEIVDDEMAPKKPVKSPDEQSCKVPSENKTKKTEKSSAGVKISDSKVVNAKKDPKLRNDSKALDGKSRQPSLKNNEKKTSKSGDTSKVSEHEVVNEEMNPKAIVSSIEQTKKTNEVRVADKEKKTLASPKIVSALKVHNELNCLEERKRKDIEIKQLKKQIETLKKDVEKEKKTRRDMREKYNKIKEEKEDVRSLNIKLQKELLERRDEEKLVAANVETAGAALTVDDQFLPVGHVRHFDQTIHVGTNKYFPLDRYNEAKSSAGSKPTDMVGALLTKIFDIDELKYGTKTGKPSNVAIGQMKKLRECDPEAADELQKELDNIKLLDPLKMNVCKELFKFWLNEMPDQDSDHLKRFDEYVSKKVAYFKKGRQIKKIATNRDNIEGACAQFDQSVLEPVVVINEHDDAPNGQNILSAPMVGRNDHETTEELALPEEPTLEINDDDLEPDLFDLSDSAKTETDASDSEKEH